MQCQPSLHLGQRLKLTSGHFVDLVLDEEINQRHKCAEEGCRQPLPPSYGSRIRRAECYAAQRPGQRRNQVADHEDIVPVMIIRRRHVCPSTTCQ